MLETQYRPILAVGYLLAALLILVPLTELVAYAAPLVPSEVRWRYGFIGFLGNNMMLPVFGYVWAVITAAMLEHRVAIRVLSAISGAAGILLLAFLGLFFLDSLQMRATATGMLLRNFDIATFKAGTALILGSGICLWVAFVGWTGSRAPKGTKPGRISPERTLVSVPGISEKKKPDVTS